MSYGPPVIGNTSSVVRMEEPPVFRKVVLVTISGTPAAFESLGGESGSWSITPEQAVKIFGQGRGARDVKSVVLRRISMLEYRSTLPDVCGVVVDGLPGNEFTQTGEDNHMFVLGTGQSQSPQDIFVASGDMALGMRWMSMYPEYNRENVRTFNVMHLNGSDYYFVHENHPVINLLYHNQSELGTKISPEDRVNGSWYRVDLNVFNDSCRTLEEDVFNKTPQMFDLTKLCVRLRRPDNRRWLEAPAFMGIASSNMEQRKEDYMNFVSSPMCFTARMEVEYSIPDGEMGAATPNVPMPTAAAPMAPDAA